MCASPAPTLYDLTDQLRRHPQARYASRPLAAIRLVVLHHSGAAAQVPRPRPYLHAIARYHVDRLGWPGIGYHLVVAQDGDLYQTNDLRTVSHHAGLASVNATAVGLCLLGNFCLADPSDAQLAGAQRALAWLRDLLGRPDLPVHPHRRFVPTACPGSSAKLRPLLSAAAPIPAPARNP